MNNHPNFKYTLAFIKSGSKILMINREKSPWKGAWNGVGGKIQEGETPRSCIKREILEETSFDIDGAVFKGILTWNNFDAKGNGLYIFLVEVDESLVFQEIIQTREGILAWKEYDWIVSSDNVGVASNIPHFLPAIVNASKPIHCHCEFDHYQLLSVTMTDYIESEQ